MTSRTINSTRNMASGLVNKAITIICPFIIRTVMNNYLGTEFLGLSSLFKSILAMLSLAELGFSSAIVFSMYKPLAEKDTSQINALLNFYKNIYRIIGSIILIGGLAIIPFLPRLMNGTAPVGINIYYIYIIYLVNTVISYFLSAYKESILVANQQNRVSLNITSLCYVGMYISQIVVIVAFKNYYIYSIIILITTIVINIVRSIVVSKMFPAVHCEGIISKKSKDDLRKKVLGLVVYKISEVCRNSFDTIVLSANLGLVVLAIYQNYYYILTAVISIFTLISNAIIASIGNSIAVETREKNLKDFYAILLIYGWIACWCVCSLACLYQPFMREWMGEQNMFDYSIVLLFCVYFYVLTIANVGFVYRQAAGLWWEDRFRPIIESISNLVLNIILIKNFGVIGILVATIITIVLLNIPLSIRVLFNNYFQCSQKNYWKNLSLITLIGLIGTSICIYVCSKLALSGWTEIIVKGIICLLLPNIFFYISFKQIKDFKRSEEIIANMLPRQLKSLFSK